MRKRILSLMLTLTLLLSMAVLPTAAQAAPEPSAAEMVTDLSDTCPCGCGKNLSDVEWRVWDPNTTGVPPTGHYYLEGDYAQNAQLEVKSGNKLVLDLRGYTLTTEGNRRLFLLSGYVAVMDSVGGGVFSANSTGGGFGGIVMLSNNETNDATFEFYSGTMMPGTESKGSRRGGFVHLSENTTFRMYGGRLMNGTTVNGSYNEPGGAIAANSTTARIEILGGEIIGCESSSSAGSIYSIGTTVLKNCRIIGGKAATYGGNICQNGGSLTIENALIADGIGSGTGNGGGNICVMSGTVLNIKNSTVRNGYSGNHGGNIYLGTSQTTIENSEVTNGVAANRGGNIYGSTAATGLTVRNCELPGDVGYIGKNLVLQGLVKIGLLNTGLRLVYGTDQGTVDASGLTEGSEIYVLAQHLFTDANTDPAYFKGANRTVITETAEGLRGAYAASGELGGYCPHCQERVAWTAFSMTDSLVQNCLQDNGTDTDTACTGRHVESGHYYLTQTHSGMAQYYIGVYLSGQGTLAAKDVVLDLCGYDMTATGRAFYLRPKDAEGNLNQLTLLDSYGSGKITGSGANNQGGGVIYNEGCKLTVYGGTYAYKPVEGRNITTGGVILTGNDFAMHGGILDGSAYTYTDASTADKTYTYYGGAVFTGNGAKSFTMTAGVVKGGHAQSGGAAHFGYNNKVNITGGQFIGGQSDTYGGAVRLYSTKSGSSYPSAGVFNMTGAVIRDGSATTAGGNLYTQYYTVNLTDCYMDGGYAGDYAGNVSIGSSAKVTMLDTRLVNGSTAKRGGNIHVASTSARATFTNCDLLTGKATTYGGNINVGNGYVDFQGCTLLHGTAGTYGGNITAGAGNYSATSDNYTRIGADETGKASLIAGGTAGTTGGNIHISGVLYLDAAKVCGGKAGTTGQDIHMHKLSKQSLFSVGSGVTGEMSVYIDPTFLSGDGMGASVNNTVCTQLNARMTMEGDYQGALLCEAGGKLSIGSVAVVDAQGGYTWYTEVADAIENCPAEGYVRLYVGQDVMLTKDCTIDICGQEVNVSGAYTVCGMDSSGDGFTVPTGKLIAAEETTVASSTDAGGKQYIAVAEETGTSFHRIQAQITEVALRPSADGLYYTGSFGCDETIGANIDSYGIAVSTVNMPGVDFMTDGDTLYTEFAGNTMENGAKKTGVLISGILKEERTAELNSAYGQMPVFATAFLKLTDGTVLLSDTESHNDDVAYSLHDMMTTLDRLIMEDPIHYRRMTNPLRQFHTKWKNDGMGDWTLNKIPDFGDNGVIDVLLIGASFNYYYVEELYGLAAAAGIPMRVCNLYGGSVENHWKWWQNGESPCQFYNTDGNGRVKTDNVGLEWALAQGEWDVISLLYPSATVRTATPQAGFERYDFYATELNEYLKEQFPDAMHCWQQVWAYQIGFDRDGYQVPDREEQLGHYQRHKELAYIAADAYDRVLVPCGEAWEFVRQDGYDQLCARLGKGTNHEGDFYHDGDIGGGQYLNACVWFEMITGQSCVGNPYVPTYVYGGQTYEILSDITVEQLQNAAHRAVAELPN